MFIPVATPVRSLLVACGLLLCAAAPAHAQKALKHSTALTGLGGCDAPGYPLTICKAGAYKLVGDLKVPAESGGVFVQVSLVTLDLNGFSIYQTGTCGAGSGNGIGSSPALTSVTVMNGTVSCHGGHGVSLLGGKHRVERVTAIANNRNGIVVGEQSLVKDSNATQNGDHGIFTTVGCTVRNNTAQANGFDGIVASGGSLVIGNTARVNGRFGLLLGGTDGYGNNVLTGNWATLTS